MFRCRKGVSKSGAERRMRAVKIIGAVLLGVVLLVLLAVGAVALGGAPLLARAMGKSGSHGLGREIRIAGAFRIDWGGPIRLVAEDVHVANADWGSAPEMFSAKRLELAVDPVPLLRLHYVVPRLALDEPK